ncbi:DUF2381 family protein [Archangium lansingense]|uniref:DUF2381 family protein n=1 Tax=Archangium lansingense TaxID=2995310 RepID=UPI003B7A2649
MLTWPTYPMQKAVLLACLAVSTAAGAHPKPIPTKYSSVHRTIFLSNDPASKVPELYVAGKVVTVLRFQQPCDRDRTKMLGWEGRFEPVECAGKKVLIEPLKDLASEDRLLLVVTLADGTELPFTVTASETRRDMQVDVHPDPESPEAVRVTLEEQRKENKRLRAQVRQQRDEIAWRSEVIDSEDHAIAMLLARGKVSLTGFKELDKRFLREGGTEILVSTLVTTEKPAPRKVAMVFHVTNTDPKRPWGTQSAQVSALDTGDSLPFAAQAYPSRIGPGQSGRVALVADLSAFDPIRDGDKIVFELFRDGGRQQGYVVWDVKHLLP